MAVVVWEEICQRHADMPTMMEDSDGGRMLVAVTLKWSGEGGERIKR